MRRVCPTVKALTILEADLWLAYEEGAGPKTNVKNHNDWVFVYRRLRDFGGEPMAIGEDEEDALPYR